MKLLVLTSRFPFPIEKGDKLRIYHQIRELSKQHEIILCALSDHPVGPDEMAEMQQYCSKVYTFRLSRLGIAWQVVSSILRGIPAQVGYFFRKPIRKKIRRIIDEEKPDHIYCQLVRMAEYARKAAVPATLDYMDAFSLGMERRADNSPFPTRTFFRWESRKLQAYEQEVYSNFTHHTIISQQDQQALSFPEKENIHIIPNGIDLEYFQPQPYRDPEYDLVFVGNMGYFPNTVAARFMVREVLPKLKGAPTLALAGARPPASLKSLANDQVAITGWVDDIRTAYSNGKIFVASLFTGSGQQNKILEAMAMGLPCVTTTLVNNAINAIPDESILLADTPEEFAAQISRLLADEAYRSQIGKAARNFVESGFSWGNSLETLEQIWAVEGNTGKMP